MPSQFTSTTVETSEFNDNMSQIHDSYDHCEQDNKNIIRSHDPILKSPIERSFAKLEQLRDQFNDDGLEEVLRKSIVFVNPNDLSNSVLRTLVNL